MVDENVRTFPDDTVVDGERLRTPADGVGETILGFVIVIPTPLMTMGFAHPDVTPDVAPFTMPSTQTLLMLLSAKYGGVGPALAVIESPVFATVGEDAARRMDRLLR